MSLLLINSGGNYVSIHLDLWCWKDPYCNRVLEGDCVYMISFQIPRKRETEAIQFEGEDAYSKSLAIHHFPQVLLRLGVCTTWHKAQPICWALPSTSYIVKCLLGRGMSSLLRRERAISLPKAKRKRTKVSLSLEWAY